MPAVIHAATIASVRQIETEDGGVYFRHLLSLYLSDARRKLDALDARLAHRDRTGVLFAAHAIKGSSDSIGAMGLAEIARQLERAAQQGDTDISTLVPLAQRLRHDFAAVENELNGIAEESMRG